MVLPGFPWVVFCLTTPVPPLRSDHAAGRSYGRRGRTTDEQLEIIHVDNAIGMHVVSAIRLVAAALQQHIDKGLDVGSVRHAVAAGICTEEMTDAVKSEVAE